MAAGGKELKQIIAIAGKLEPSLKKAISQAEKMASGMNSKLAKGAQLAGAGAKAVGKATLAATAAAAAGIGAVAKASLDNYASYEQLVGGVETLFGDNAETMIKNAKNAYATAGMDANNYMETVTSFSASMIQSLGGDTKKATEYADMAIRDMSDNANKMGTSIESIQQTYQSLARGNYGMLDNLKLGYGGTKAEMQRLLEDAKALKAQNGETVDYSIDKYSDIVDAIHVVQENMGITGTTAKEASTTIEGSVNSAKAAWSNWLTALADDDADIGAQTEILIQSVLTAAQNIIPRVAKILGTLLQTLPQYLPEVFNTLGTELGGMLETTLAACFGEAGGEVGASLNSMLQSVFGMLPSLLGTVASVASAIMPTICLLFTGLADVISQLAPLMMDFFGQLGPMISNVFSQLIPILMELMTTLLPPLMSIIISIMPVVTQVIGLVMQLVSALMPVVQPIMQLVQTLLPPIVGLITGIMGVLQPVISVIGAIASAIGTLVGGISQVISLAGQAANALAGIGNFIGGGIAGLLGFATGGFTNGIAIAGEDPRYPTEAVISFNPAYRASNIKYWRMAGAMLGATQTVYQAEGFAAGGFTNGGVTYVGASLGNDGYGLGSTTAGSEVYDLSGLSFSPQITVRGNANTDEIIEAIRSMEPEFVDFVIEALRKREEGEYV